MDRETFLLKLRQSLTGYISPEEVDQHVEYYRDYINMQIRMGESEESVMNGLGDPRLIAKSILSANEAGVEDAEYREEEAPTRSDRHVVINHTNLPAWLVLLIVGIVLLMIVLIVGKIIISLSWIIFPVIVIAIIVKYFRDWMR